MEPQKPETENELKPKVRALYEAVLELLNENADISTMKVSDITSRAGIGKGTAYDSKSKEEIIACAVMYDARRQGMETREKLRELPDFRPASGIASTGWRNACGNRRLSESCLLHPPSRRRPG